LPCWGFWWRVYWLCVEEMKRYMGWYIRFFLYSLFFNRRELVISWERLVDMWHRKLTKLGWTKIGSDVMGLDWNYEYCSLWAVLSYS
jgi:hypothetical protein